MGEKVKRHTKCGDSIAAGRSGNAATTTQQQVASQHLCISPQNVEHLAKLIAQQLVPLLSDASDGRALTDAHGVAELLGCSVATVERRTRSGEIPSIKIGRLRRYDRAAVLRQNEKGGCNE